MKNTLFAIYKNNNHKGNIRANNQNEAIKKFIVASGLSEFSNDECYLLKFESKIAIKEIHF